MRIVRRRLLLVVSAAVSAAAVVPLAAATPPQTAAGAGTSTPPVLTSSRQADGNTFLEFTNHGTVTGTFTGTFVQTGRMIIHSDGSTETTSLVVFTGTADGCGTGTAAFRFVGQNTTGHVESIDSADNTVNVHSNTDLVLLPNGAFTYSGTYHCG
jgi:hypothetical protein